jgi:hypothetical protein
VQAGTAISQYYLSGGITEMTWVGIDGADWDHIHELAVDMVNCVGSEDQEREVRTRTALLTLLDRLDEKYGIKPSLLATRADYVDSAEEKERLLTSAYSEAERIADEFNRQLIAHSLAAFYIETAATPDEGARWLGVWRSELGTEPTEGDLSELARLEAILLTGGAT